MLPEDIDLPDRTDGSGEVALPSRAKVNPSEWDDPTFDEVCERLDAERLAKRRATV